MLWRLLQDPKISAVLSLILGAFLTYLLSLRKLSIERRYQAAELEEERKKHKRLRYLNDLFKTYATFVVAITELDICAKTRKCDSRAIDDRVRECRLALTQINLTAPMVIFDLANKCWGLVVLIVNNDKRCPPGFLSNALFAHLADFNWLAKAHMHEEDVELPALESAVFRLNAGLDEWMKAPFGEGDKDPFMDWVNSLPTPE